ncbi:MAG: hypothetical protein HY739_07175 [Desulfobacterales bacterium]|nr:hypothetical protein [Desulfobacterales bacterium]
MTITEKENLLFDEWRKNREGFVSDGLVDEVSYLKSGLKLMFVLKEVNDPDGGDWDFRQFVREGGRSQTWDNITRWVKGVRSLPSEVKWNELSEITETQRRDILMSICAINLKKSPGGHTTDNQSLWDVSNKDKEFIRRQFALYEADVVIGCGSVTTDLLYSLIDFGADPGWMMTTRGVWYHEYLPKKFVISYAHPEARVADCLLYYGLIDALREILQ